MYLSYRAMDSFAVISDIFSAGFVFLWSVARLHTNEFMHLGGLSKGQLTGVFSGINTGSAHSVCFLARHAVLRVSSPVLTSQPSPRTASWAKCTSALCLTWRCYRTPLRFRNVPLSSPRSILPLSKRNSFYATTLLASRAACDLQSYRRTNIEYFY
jgi:hypothetical protein